MAKKKIDLVSFHDLFYWPVSRLLQNYMTNYMISAVDKQLLHILMWDWVAH